jgi:hypothetical protein
MPKTGGRPRQTWEQLSAGGQLIYLALAEGDEQRARQLHQQDQQPRGRKRRRPRAAPKPPTRDLRGFVVRGRRLEPREMAAAEAWKRRQAHR